MVYTLNMGVLNYCDMIIYIYFLLQAHICNTLLKILRLLKTLRRVIWSHLHMHANTVGCQVFGEPAFPSLVTFTHAMESVTDFHARFDMYITLHIIRSHGGY